MTAPALVVRVLTPLPEIRVDGQVVELRGKAGQLFVLLVDGVVERPRLIRLLWRRRPDNAENRLYITRSDLRKLLEPFGLQDMIATVHGTGYQFVPGAAVVDLYLFRADLAEAESYLAKRNYERAATAAVRATNRWSGFPPLVTPGTRKDYRRAFAIQIEACEATGNPQEVTVWDQARDVLPAKDYTLLYGDVEQRRAAAAARAAARAARSRRGQRKVEGGDADG